MRRFKFVVQNITAKIVYTRICMGTIQKIRTDVNVLHAAIHRIEWLFETFSSVCLSFSEEKTLLCCSILRPMWLAGRNVISLYYSLTGKLSTSAQLHTF